MGAGGAFAATGRFIPRDPTGSNQYADGMNLYQYVGDNPMLFSDPLGLRKGPGMVKQTRGPDGDGQFSEWHIFRTNLFRRTNVVTDSSGRKHKLGHTWIAMGPGGGLPSYGFYPEDYGKSLITIIPGVSTSGIIPGLPGSDAKAKANQPPSDPLNGKDNQGNRIRPDWTWDTEVPDRDDGSVLQAGPGANKKIPCHCATDAQIQSCVRSVAEEWGRTNWSVRRHCQDFVVDALRKCCMKAANRQKG